MTSNGRLGSYLLAGIIAALSIQFGQAGNTTCVNNQVNLLSWYTNVVGETPCMTYQRLRQICNNDFQVHIDARECTACCCNTIAYHLSMLCMVCQQESTSNGIDAREPYHPIANKTLPSGIQSAVCNENIRIDNFLYDLDWSTGDCTYAKETAEADHAAHSNNTFTRCQNDVVPQFPTSLSPSPTFTSAPQYTYTSLSGVSSTSPTPSSDEKSKSSSNTPVIGSVIGGLVFLAVTVLAMVIWRCRRKNHQANPFTPGRLVPEGRTASSVSYSTSNPSQSAAASIEPSFRHNDGGPLGIPRLTRPNSGDLPPAYEPSSESDWERSRRTHLSAGSVSIPPSNFANSDFSDDKA
ncbi:hypothetical protein V8D89_005460 [Ganoderma adspersum]